MTRLSTVHHVEGIGDITHWFHTEKILVEGSEHHQKVQWCLAFDEHFRVPFRPLDPYFSIPTNEGVVDESRLWYT